MSKINKALAIVAALAFFLPFITISCNKQVLVEVTGAKLVQCSISTCSPKDVFSPKIKATIPGLKIPDTDIPTPAGKMSDMDDVKLVLSAAIAALVAIIALFVAGRGGELLSGVASVAAIVCLFIFRSKFTDVLGPQLNSPEMKTAGMMLQIQMQFASGFWLSVIASACSAVLAFKGTSAAQSAASSAGGGAVAGFTPQPPAGASSGGAGAGTLCTSCGASNTSGNKFCLSCGAALATAPSAAAKTTAAPVPPPAPATPQGTSCPSCGASNPEGNKFCLSCGGSLMASVQIFQPKETSAPPPPVTAAPADADQPVGDTTSLNAPATMAAAAAASPAGQPLLATAPSREPQPPAATSTAAPEVVERQPSLDLQTPQPDPPQSPEPTCTACGALITTGQKFCLSCGTPVGQAAKPADTQASTVPQVSQAGQSQPQQQVCSACNAPLSEGQKFCLACGTPVGQPATSAQIPLAPPPPTDQLYQAPAETQLFQEPTKSSAKTVVIVVVVLAVLGGGGWYGWKYFTRPDVTVNTFPQKTHVAAGGKTSLQANVSGSNDTDIDWTVQEGAKGGSVIGLGSGMIAGQVGARALYNAPQTSGVFHVIATSHANPGRSAKIEIVVGGSIQPDTSASTPEPPATSAPVSTTSASPANPRATQIIGTWRGPSPGMQTVIGADSTISMTGNADATQNHNGTYRFTDNSHVQIDFGNGDVRTWEIIGVDGNYLRVTSQSKDGTSAIIFAKVQ